MRVMPSNSMTSLYLIHGYKFHDFLKRFIRMYKPFAVPARPFFCWGGGGNIQLGHLEAGVSEQGGQGAMPPPMLEEGGQSIISPPPRKCRGPRPTRLSIFHS